MKSAKSINLCKSVIQTIYDIVKAHSGELSVISEAEKGSTFIIHLHI